MNRGWTSRKKDELFPKRLATGNGDARPWMQCCNVLTTDHAERHILCAWHFLQLWNNLQYDIIVLVQYCIDCMYCRSDTVCGVCWEGNTIKQKFRTGIWISELRLQMYRSAVGRCLLMCFNGQWKEMTSCSQFFNVYLLTTMEMQNSSIPFLLLQIIHGCILLLTSNPNPIIQNLTKNQCKPSQTWANQSKVKCKQFTHVMNIELELF